MKVRELQAILDRFDPEADVVINPDITVGRYKNSPGNRQKRFSYAPDYEITKRQIRMGTFIDNVVCIGLAEEVGTVNPTNQI